MVAGIAREFDQEYLPSMPIVLILPALVSLLLCLLFYAYIRALFYPPVRHRNGVLHSAASWDCYG